MCFFDAQDFATLHFKINVLEYPNIVARAFGASVVRMLRQFASSGRLFLDRDFPCRALGAPERAFGTVQVVTQRARSYLPEAVWRRSYFRL